MIDEDGFERPDDLNAHENAPVEGTRKIKFDEKYQYCPRNIFFRFWMNVFKLLAGGIVYPFFVFIYKIRVLGRKNLKKLKNTGCVVTINHIYPFDVLGLAGSVLFFKRVYTVTLQASIKRRFVGFWMRSVGCIPIPSGSLAGMRKFEDDIAYILKKQKNPVVLAPEGALWIKYRKVRPFKKGAFAIAVKNEVAVLPVALVFKRKQKKRKKDKYYFTYIVGEPLYADANIENKTLKIQDLQERTQNWYQKTVSDWYKNANTGFSQIGEQDDAV